MTREKEFIKVAGSIEVEEYDSMIKETEEDIISNGHSLDDFNYQMFDETVDGLIMNLDGLSDKDYINYINTYGTECYSIESKNKIIGYAITTQW